MNEQTAGTEAEAPKPKAKKTAPKKVAAKKVAAKKVAKKVAPKNINGEVTMKDQLKAHSENYTKHKMEDGRTVIDNGDEVAEALRGMDLEEVYKYAAKTLKQPLAELKAKYEHLNKGQQRMNLGNRLRKAVRDAAAE